jgi:hypothetical protein
VSVTNVEPATNQQAGDDHTDDGDEGISRVVFWQSAAVIAMVASIAGVAATRAIDLCSSIGPEVLAVAWLVAPIATISSIVGVAVVSRNTFERITAAVVAALIAGAWIFALIWASVGEAMQRSAC